MLKMQVLLMLNKLKTLAINNDIQNIPKIPTQEEIEKKLQDKLISLRAEYTNKINDVIASAIVEYKAAEGGENKQEIFNKYIELVRELELECDARVYATIAKAENKLMKYNYNTDIADIAREEYKRQKEEKRNQLLESFLNNLTN